MKTITKSFVAKLKPSAAEVEAGKRQQLYDENLSVAILPSGRLTFYVYSTKGGKRNYRRLMSLSDNKIHDRQLQMLNAGYRKYWSNIHYEIGAAIKKSGQSQNQIFHRSIPDPVN
jgi:hypothetical protein